MLPSQATPAQEDRPGGNPAGGHDAQRHQLLFQDDKGDQRAEENGGFTQRGDHRQRGRVIAHSAGP